MTDYSKMPTWSHQELANRISDDASTTLNGVAMGEYYRRLLVYQEQSTEAQRASAEYAKQNVRFMLLSVVVLALSSVATLIATLLTVG